MVTSAIPPREDGRAIKRCAASRALGVVVTVHVEGGEASEGVQEVPQPQPERALRALRRRRPLGLHRGENPPDVRAAVFEAAVLPEGEVAVAVCPNPCAVWCDQIHVLYLERVRGPATNLFDPPSAAVV